MAALQALFVGADDSETCAGCEDAMDGNPYDVDDCPEPGSFECMSRCRHMIQLVGGDEDDDEAEGPTLRYVGSVGFEPNNTPFSAFPSLVDEDVPEVPTPEGHEQMAKASAEPNLDDWEQNPTALNELLGINFADLSNDDIQTLAYKIINTGLDPEDIVDGLALTPDEADKLTAAAEDAEGELVDDFGDMYIAELLDDGSDVRIFDMMQNNHRIHDIILAMASAGFDDEHANQAITLASVINMFASGAVAYIGQDGRWYVTVPTGFQESLREGGAGSGDHGHADVPGRRGGSAPATTRHYLISGRVQGVKFRANAIDAANQLGIHADARNLPSSQVEIQASGDPDKLDQYEAYLHKGNPGSIVTSVSTLPGTMKSLSEFNPGEIGPDRKNFSSEEEFNNYFGFTKVAGGKLGDGVSCTAYYERPITLSTRFLASLPRRYQASTYSAWNAKYNDPNHVQWNRVDAIADEIRQRHYGDVVTVQVTPDGKPTISEGQWIIDKAEKDGSKNIRTVVQFFGGGEGLWTPYNHLQESLREGGAGSGDYGHAGRPGKVGGSLGTDRQISDDYAANLSRIDPIVKSFVDDNVTTENFDGILYRTARTARDADEIKQGRKFYNTDAESGTYGPGLYFASLEKSAEMYGKWMFKVHVTAKLASMDRKAYMKLLGAIYAGGEDGDELAKNLIADWFQSHGYDGIRIRNVVPNTARTNDGDYIVDFKADQTLKGFVEAEAGAVDAVILWKRSLLEGGAGSGDHGHAGRKGFVGGSARGYSADTLTGYSDDSMHGYSSDSTSGYSNDSTTGSSAWANPFTTMSTGTPEVTVNPFKGFDGIKTFRGTDEQLSQVGDILQRFVPPAMRSQINGNIFCLTPDEKFVGVSPSLTAMQNAGKLGVNLDALQLGGLTVYGDKTLYIRSGQITDTTVIHEMGHLYDQTLGDGKKLYSELSGSEVNEAWQDANNNPNGSLADHFVTPYASKGTDEFFAESFRAYCGANSYLFESKFPNMIADRAKLIKTEPRMFRFFSNKNVA
jgi:acylphosphatase